MNTLTIDIRKAEPRDADAIAEVHHEAWRGAYSGIIPHRALTAMINRRGGEWWANAIRRAATVLVIEIGGKIAGYATLGRNRARELKQQGEIYELYLRPECQGIGLGSRLFAAARQRLADHGLKGMVVWALEENENALSFYAGAGGRDIAEGVEVFDQKALKKVAFVWE
ncbi:GNAT family N-acetyltransferase [Aminobacter aganoensis]|uniref:Ribosomal protein S18 acetylase RimI-like enzyme n=2 Tax=Aminobacter TaxID=31988 RepID=A0A7X0F9F2_9HYPH|nr:MULTISPECIES: GNAT family N-acetyltransferase [Aminobacter]AWC21719.1 putative acetyltransferase [Aminobacter sp. MSH1]KQU73104.1 GCN5 family acetyltransferase [Aminobacter sp. DSM 101952]MBB4650869.1 ribosomal protein S18 acetylase RimI-like enzyme [Aminobacter niigataensis]MBB6355562.1 ribosomal protein S18 acetylase RimI-like enzyme [Aminobacter aganoensis]CAI2932485.1 Histone acetyltransferase HPA2 and related acetyltransferases [Aminobacter niigataensis]